MENKDQSSRNCYTYLIGWKEHNKFYYGVRFAKNCSPDDFWVKYFTSSNEVKKFRKEFGEPDIIEIRKTFGDNPIKAQRWERRFILRMRCVRDDKWLNRGNGGFEFNPSSGKRARSPECRRKISERRKQYCANPANKEFIQKNAENAAHKGREKNSQKAKERFQDKEWFENIHLASHRTPEYREKSRQMTTQRYAEGRMEKFYEKIKSPEHSDDMSRRMQEAMQNPDTRKKMSVSIKKKLEDPEIRKQMSERAKASTEKRLQSRKIMAALREKHQSGIPLTLEDAASIGCNSIAMAINKLEDYLLSRERRRNKKSEASIQ